MLIAVPSFTSRAIAAFLATVGWTVASQADPVSVRVPLSGMEEVPPVQTAGSGVVWLSKQGSPADSPLTGQTILTPEQAVQFAAGQLYVNVHTQANPGGEIRGQAIPPKN
jgi:CHRD domain